MSSGSTLPMASSARTGSVIFSLFLCIVCVLAGDPNEYYSELPLSSTGREELSADQVKSPRLLDLLQLKQSMSELLPSGPNSRDDGKMEELDVSKRLFCNSFSGCGGHSRGRRRQQQPVAEIGKRLLRVYTKRPFCNTYGCYNNGKKRSAEVGTELRDDASQMSEQKFKAFADGWSGNKIKRLFCNGYGGCQNMGKRLAFLGAQMTDEVGSENQRLLPSFSKTTPDKFTGSKRFFSSSFDDDVDSLIDTLKR